MKRNMKGGLVASGLLAILLLGGLLGFISKDAAVETFLPERFSGRPIIIDAGHGGEDGGAVAADGTVESGINLAVALRLDAIFGLYGVDATLLRSTDRSLHDDTAKTLREKKVSDLHNRVASIQAVPNVTLVSIHQNTFQNVRYHGAQVFYAGGALSQPFAALTQETLRLALDAENSRQPTKIPDTVYLMKHVSCRAILVECGFLSNPEEAKILTTERYQTKVAAALAASYLQFLQLEEGE